MLLAARVDPFVLGDHLGQRLRLPARPVVAAVAALQRFESLDQQWHQLRRTRRVRGLDVGRSPLARARQVGALTAGLLVQSLRQAGRMAVAMEARGFSAPRAEGRAPDLGRARAVAPRGLPDGGAGTGRGRRTGPAVARAVSRRRAARPPARLVR